MKKSKTVRLFAVIVAFCLLLTGIPVYTSAAYTVTSGSCGDNLTYTLDSDGVLTISGTGDMTSHPWVSYKTQIKTVTIKDSVTSIGHNAIPEETVIYGYAGSYAQIWAEENDRSFVEIGDLICGDVDGNGELTAADARLILRYSVKLESKFPVEK